MLERVYNNDSGAVVCKHQHRAAFGKKYFFEVRLGKMVKVVKFPSGKSFKVQKSLS